MAPESPFSALKKRDFEKILSSCPPLGVALHKFEKEQISRFCKKHAKLDKASQSTWRLHAALLHFMLRPILQIFQRSTIVAATALGSARPEDLELAFRENARDGYVWLQCLMSEESEWCITVGCPTCSATNILSSEMTVRATLTAAIYSSSSEDSAPDFSPVISALKNAISKDPFWKSPPVRFSSVQSRAERISENLEDLARQCTELEILVTSPPGSDGSVAGSVGSNDSIFSTTSSSSRVFGGESELTRLRPSKMAKRQLQLREEEVEIVANMVRGWMIDREEGW